MNNQALLHQIVWDMELSADQLARDIKDLQSQGLIPDNITEFSVHSSLDDTGNIWYDIYPRFKNIIEITL